MMGIAKLFEFGALFADVHASDGHFSGVVGPQGERIRSCVAI